MPNREIIFLNQDGDSVVIDAEDGEIVAPEATSATEVWTPYLVAVKGSPITIQAAVLDILSDLAVTIQESGSYGISLKSSENGQVFYAIYPQGKTDIVAAAAEAGTDQNLVASGLVGQFSSDGVLSAENINPSGLVFDDRTYLMAVFLKLPDGSYSEIESVEFVADTPTVTASHSIIDVYSILDTSEVTKTKTVDMSGFVTGDEIIIVTARQNYTTSVSIDGQVASEILGQGGGNSGGKITGYRMILEQDGAADSVFSVTGTGAEAQNGVILSAKNGTLSDFSFAFDQTRIFYPTSLTVTPELETNSVIAIAIGQNAVFDGDGVSWSSQLTVNEELSGQFLTTEQDTTAGVVKDTTTSISIAEASNVSIDGFTTGFEQPDDGTLGRAGIAVLVFSHA